MFSAPSRLGAVVSRHRAVPGGDLVEVAAPAVDGRRQDQADGQHRAGGEHARQAGRERQPGQQDDRVRLHEDPDGHERAGETQLIDLRREQRADEHRAQEDVGLAEVELVRVELPHEQDREPDQRPLGLAPLGQAADRPADERAQQPDRQREPDRLRGLRIEPCERRHGERKGRQVLELVVAVAFTIERLAGERARRGRAVDLEVHHLALDAHDVDHRGERDDRQRPRERPEPLHARQYRTSPGPSAQGPGPKALVSPSGASAACWPRASSCARAGASASPPRARRR